LSPSSCLLSAGLEQTNRYITSAVYNASDQLTNLAFQSGTTTTYGYDPNNNRLTSLVTSGNIQNLAYTYDNVGNVKTISDYLHNAAQVTTFNYDDLNRLKDATLPGAGGYAHSWTYTPIGNMLTRNDNNGNVTYQYNDAAHKHAVTQAGANYVCGVYPEALREREREHDAPQCHHVRLYERRCADV
jgi:YD repeat-containing protein